MANCFKVIIISIILESILYAQPVSEAASEDTINSQPPSIEVDTSYTEKVPPAKGKGCLLEGLIINKETGEFPESKIVNVLVDSVPVVPDNEGNFIFQNISLGTHTVTIQSEEFKPYSITVVVRPDKKNYFLTCILEKRTGTKPVVIKKVLLKRDSVIGPPWTITGYIVDSRLDLSIEDKKFFMLFDQDKIPVNENGSFKIQTHYRGMHTFYVRIQGYHDISESIVLTNDDKQPFVILPTTLLKYKVNRRQITVSAKRQPVHLTSSVSTTKIERKDMERTTATLSDPVRLLHTLPSVSSESDASARPVVRGGDVLEARMFLDGVTLIQPYHFGGARSTFNQAALDNLIFFKSGFPAKFHNAQSAIISVNSRKPAKDSLHIELDYNLLQYSTYIGIPFNNHKWGINGSIQGSYFDFMSKLIVTMANNDYAKEYRETVNLPDYQDYSIGINFKPNDKFQVYVNDIFNTDRFKVTQRDSMYPVTYYYEKYYKIVNGAPQFFDFDTGDPDLRDTNFTITQNFDYYDYYESDDWIEYIAPIDNPVSYERGNPGFEVDTIILYYSNYNILYATAQFSPSDNNIFSITTAWQKRWWDVSFPDDNYSFSEHSIYKVTLDQLNANINWVYSGFKNNIISSGVQIDYTIVPYDVYVVRALHEIITKGSTNFGDYWGPLTQDTGAIIYNYIDPVDVLSNVSAENVVDRLYVYYKGKDKYINAGIYLEDDITIGKRFNLTLGSRLEYSSLDHHKSLSPRISGKFSLNKKNELIGSVGLYTQNNYDIAALAMSTELKPEKVWHASIGTESRILQWLNQKIDIFGKYYYDLVSEHIKSGNSILSESTILALSELYTSNYIDSILDEDPEYYIKLAKDYLFNRDIYYSYYTNNGKGYSFGLEYFLRYNPTDYWHGWLSLSYCRSFRQRHPGWRWHSFPLDRPFQLSLVNYYRLPRKYEISIKYRLMSGIPYTDTNLEYDDWVEPDTLYIGPYNEKRYSSYQSLDFKIAKGFSIRNAKGHIYLETWNVLNSPNMFLKDKDTKKLKTVGMNLPFTSIFIGIDFKI